MTRSAAPPPTTGMSAQVATLEAVMWAMVTPIMAVDRSRSGLPERLQVADGGPVPALRHVAQADAGWPR